MINEFYYELNLVNKMFGLKLIFCPKSLFTGFDIKKLISKQQFKQMKKYLDVFQIINGQ